MCSVTVCAGIAILEAALTVCLLPFFGPAKKKSSEELGEAHAVWKALHRELDSRKWDQKRDPEISCPSVDGPVRSPGSLFPPPARPIIPFASCSLE